MSVSKVLNLKEGQRKRDWETVVRTDLFSEEHVKYVVDARPTSRLKVPARFNRFPNIVGDSRIVVSCWDDTIGNQ